MNGHAPKEGREVQDLPPRKGLKRDMGGHYEHVTTQGSKSRHFVVI